MAKNEIEKKKDMPLAEPINDWAPTAEETESWPRLIIHQGDISEKYYGAHPKGTLLDSVTRESVGAVPLQFVAIGVNWTEYIRFGEKFGAPMVYRHKSKAAVPPEDLEWHGTEPPACSTIFNHMILIEGREVPILISLRGSSKHDRRFKDALNQYQQIRRAKKIGPGLYEFNLADAENDKGKWKVPTLRYMGNPPKAMLDSAMEWYRALANVEIKSHVEGGSEPAYDPNSDG